MLKTIDLEISPFDEKMLISQLYKNDKEITYQQFVKAFSLDYDAQGVLDIKNSFKLLGWVIRLGRRG